MSPSSRADFSFATSKRAVRLAVTLKSPAGQIQSPSVSPYCASHAFANDAKGKKISFGSGGLVGGGSPRKSRLSAAIFSPWIFFRKHWASVSGFGSLVPLKLHLGSYGLLPPASSRCNFLSCAGEISSPASGGGRSWRR